MTAKSFAMSLLTIAFFAWTAAADEVRGLIIKADDAKRELTIEGRGKGVRRMALKFVLDDDTEIRLGKQPGKASDLVPGKRERRVSESRGRRRVARSITRLRVAGAAAAPH